MDDDFILDDDLFFVCLVEVLDEDEQPDIDIAIMRLDDVL